MAGARWAALAVAGTIVVGAAGCGGSDDEGGTRLSVVTAGARDDADWTMRTVSAAERVARRLHVSSEVVEPASDEEAARALRRLARDALLLVAPHHADREAARRIAASAEVPTLVWGDPDALRDGLVGDVEVALAQGAYAAGVLASHASFQKSVGIVLCDDGTREQIDERFSIAAAYVAGARADEPRVKASFVIAGADEGGAKQATLELVKRGMQMILALCGPAVGGVVQGVEQAIKTGETGETQMVALVGEKTALNRENIILTSILVNPDVAFEQALRDVRTDRFGTRVYTLDWQNGGIGLLQTGRTPGDAYEAAVEAVEQEAVELPEAGDEVELDAVIKDVGRTRS